jgi:hypothetical protein
MFLGIEFFNIHISYSNSSEDMNAELMLNYQANWNHKIFVLMLL